MWKIIYQLSRLHRREIITLVFSLSIFLFILSFSNQLISFVSSSQVNKREKEIKNNIQTELDTASKDRDEIIASKVLNNYIKNRDIFQLLTITQGEAKSRDIDSMVITDKEGFVLIRSHMPNQRGDNLFQTTAHGRRIAQGQTITSVTRGGRAPLVFVSASPLQENGETIGGISTGYTINNSYAHDFGDKYLQKNEQVAFYTPREGVVGDSFQNKEITQLINAYFSIGSELVTQDFTELEKEIKIDNKYYIVRNVILGGIEESPGGLLIFFPINHNHYSGLIATITIIIFFFIYYLTIFVLKFLYHHKHRTPIIAILGLIIFLLTYYVTLIKLNSSATEIKKTPYVIYNSTMKFEPESDIINKLSNKTIAIKVYTGGEAINVVRAIIKYNPKMLKVLDILTTNSLCDQTDFLSKDIDNKKGEVKIVCHTPNINPGFYEPSGTVAELLVSPLSVGDFSLEFSPETQVLASDGLETNVLRKTTGAFYHIVDQKLTANVQSSIPIFSPNHPNSNRWYQNKNIQLAWPQSKDYKYYYAFNKTPDFKLEAANSLITNNYLDQFVPESGIYYFHLKAVDKNGKTGPVAHFKINIDNTPPLPPNIQASTTLAKKGDIARLSFTGVDNLSGVQSGFYIRINDSIFLPVKPPFFLPLLKEGDYNVIVRVFDKANNFNDNSITIHVTE